MGQPVNGIAEIAGPEQFRLDELIRGVLRARNDPRKVITDPRAQYFGITPSERTLLPENFDPLSPITGPGPKHRCHTPARWDWRGRPAARCRR